MRPRHVWRPSPVNLARDFLGGKTVEFAESEVLPAAFVQGGYAFL